MAQDHSNRSVMVTGGTTGIGRAVAERLTSEGASVWIVGSDPGRLAMALAAGVAVGGTVCDVAEEAQVVAAYDEMSAAIGAPHAGFVNAGIDGQGVPTTELDPAVMLRVLAVNVVGAMLCAREAARRMTGAGSICINASVNGIRPEAGFADYNASKAAAISLARTMALEWSGRGISVTALCPGYFPTPMTTPFLDDPDTLSEIVSQIPAGRIGRLDEVAAMASFLLSPDSAFATGGVFTIDGGRNV